MDGMEEQFSPLPGRPRRLLRRAVRCLFSFLMPLVIVVIGGVAFLAVLTRNVSILNDPRWIKTPCTVQYSQISCMYGDKTDSYYYLPKVTLAYQIKDRNYETVYQDSPSSYCSTWDVQRWVGKYPRGRTVFCYVNSLDPGYLKLHRNYSQIIYQGLIPLTLISLVLVLTFRVLRSYWHPSREASTQAETVPSFSRLRAFRPRLAR